MKNQDHSRDVLNVQGIREKGYGIVPKLVMQDRRLTTEAKAIYAYFCSFAGAGTTAFPGREKIIHDLNVSLTRYYKHFNLLKDFGYILVEQEQDKDGKFKRNLYTLCEIVPSPKNGDCVPCSQNEYTAESESRSPCTRLPYTVNEYTNINSSDNNNIYKSSHSQSHVKSKEKTDNDETMTHDSRSPKEEMPKYSETDYNTYRRIIEDNINYKSLVQAGQDAELVNNLVEVMLDVICTESPVTVKMGNEVKSREIVKSVYMKLDYNHIQHVISRYKAQRHQITHKNAYLRKMLYTAYQEIDAHYTNQVRADGVVW
jgi:hypothetical protein